MRHGVALSVPDQRLRAFRVVRSLRQRPGYGFAGTRSFDYRVLLFENLTSGRFLDRQNAHPVAVAKDFERFGVDIWEQVEAMRSGNDERRKKLEALITWRNAIAHHDIDAKLNRGALEPASINFDTCKG